MRADLYVVGVGMVDLRQLTLQAFEVIQTASAVYHLSTRHHQLAAINPRTHNLERFYSRRHETSSIYDNVAAFVVSEAVADGHIVFALEGNAMIFSDVSWKIAAAGRKAGLVVEAIPGVSCLDVLPIQLGFDPGDLGLQIFEASQLVIYGLTMNPHVSTLILQIGYFLHDVTLLPVRRPPDAFAPLVDHLTRFFPGDHPAVFIESADSEQSDTIVFTVPITSIDEHRHRITPGMTLYIPRVAVPPVRAEFRRLLGLDGE